MREQLKEIPRELMGEFEAIGESYDYPGGLDFRPGSELHDDLVDMVLSCAQEGYDTTSQFVDDMVKVDNIRDGVMPADALDRMRKQHDPRKPVNVVMPMLYAHEQLMLTAMHRAFFSGQNFHRFQGPGTPERAAKAALAEKLLGRMSMWFNERRAADIHWGDGIGYGRGYMWGKWSKRTAPALVDEEVDDALAMALQGMGLEYSAGDVVRYIDEAEETRREGTEWIPIDPYQALVDPNVTPDRFQDSAFFGWVSRTDAMLLLGKEDDPEEGLFNCKALERYARKSQGQSRWYREVSGRRRPEGDPSSHGHEDSRCDVIYKFIRLIPRRHGLGDSEKPQVWMFAVGADRILIKAERVRTLHGGLPVVCCAPNARGHDIAPVSNLMITYGQQIAVDFLVKQRLDFQDVIKNGKFIFDPVMLDWKAMAKGGGPMGIPMKKRAMGKDIASFYHQIRVEDVTQGNWGDVGNIMQMAKEGNGIVESPQNLPERPTATGIDAIEERSTGRMARMALTIDEQSRMPMAYQSLCNAAQWMDTEVILDIVGRDDDIIRQGYGLPPGATGLLVSAWDIDPDFDVVPLSKMTQGPKNVAAMTEFAKTLLGAPGALEMFMRQFRFEEFLTSYFREMGISDIDWYRMNVQMAPDQYVQQQMQAGNMVPMREAAPGYNAPERMAA
jgi:hypothetical protein